MPEKKEGKEKKNYDERMVCYNCDVLHAKIKKEFFFFF